MDRFSSPLRYPGGKSSLISYMEALFRINQFVGGVYVEPYAGGASLALTLLFREYASCIYINDLDKALYAFWDSVLNDTERLCRKIRDTQVTPQEWERQRRIYMRSTDSSRLSLGFATFFLNRTNRSGIIASGGMIGGRKQRGRWKIDARYNGPNLAKRIERIALYRDRIHLFNLDAIDFLRFAADELALNSMVYLDPPYYVKGKRRLYTNYYNHDDHASVAGLLPQMPFRWLISYDNTPAIRRLYRSFPKREYSIGYTAAERHQGSEVMFFSPNLLLPRGASLGG